MTEKQSKSKMTKSRNPSNLPSKSPANKKSKKNPKREDTKLSKKKQRKSGPRLPSVLLQELDRLNPNPRSSDSESNDEAEAKVAGDLYEYEEEMAQEETKKNRRYDPVENYEYELPEDFKDEDVPSDDDEDIPSDQSDNDDEEGDKHLRMLEGITGMPSQAFDGKEKREVVLSDLQGDFSDGKLRINDLLDPLHGKSGYGKLRKRLHQLESKPMTVQAPLPKVEREKLERKVAYEHSKKDITKWEPLVKRNREAPTLYFQEDVDVGVPTVGAIASEFEPRTEFEKKMAALVRNPDVAEAHLKDGAKLLELNKFSTEDVRERQNRLAKMRSLLFRHEMKSKHIKKIKSKTYHRILKKEKLKAAAAGVEMDPESAKELAIKQEFKRAQERMTLKHKNTSQWAKRKIKRGLQAQDEGTRAAITEQLQQHVLLTRKMNSMKDSSSSDESSDDDVDDDDAELSPGEENDKAKKIINRAKEKTIKVLEEEDEKPKSGLLALPFMERSLKKQNEAAKEEARLALQEYDSSLGHLENDDKECSKSKKLSGRKVFGAVKNQPEQPSKRIEPENMRNSDSEDDFESKEHEDRHEIKSEVNNVHIGSALLDEESDMGQKSVFKNFEDIMKDPGPKTSYDVAIFASGSWKKMKGENKLETRNRRSEGVAGSAPPSQDIKAMDQNSDSDSDEEMVDGIHSVGAKVDYELPSQADLIHSAFAGDDVEAEFEKDKLGALNEENPEPEKPVLLPGWGQWTNVQQKRGPPSWMLEEHEKAKRKREDALKKRKDSNLKHVIISEKIDKKAEKLHANTLPFPYRSKEVYEQSIRMPLGPEYNPAISVNALNRPAVVKKAGTIIKPIKYEEVEPYGKSEEPNHGNQKPKAKKAKVAGGKSNKKA
ncbi:uncharacterized protein A4U43_C07F9440 [Asparagus officinalis]|uniref:Uncharacterized protein n=1 Tax=Asparagus officinalis TaxID=4686 RepID=A0A5P1EAK9_ASPOF|nr:uncharacterized protein C57A7.06 [Asparagus officinalis]ONK62915.1 uncharacterized protein A4U43_C07F9440 [Asparagus officinalis]